jgi:hypothetical protein
LSLWKLPPHKVHCQSNCFSYLHFLLINLQDNLKGNWLPALYNWNYHGKISLEFLEEVKI